ITLITPSLIKHAYPSSSLPFSPLHSLSISSPLSTSIVLHSASCTAVKAAYKRKVWDVHPDRFPAAQRTLAESPFKLLSEAYACLSTTYGAAYSQSAYTRVVRSGVARPNAGSRHHPLLPLPFLFIILGTLGLGGLSVARCYCLSF
ncbi:hypothetical protein RND81_13G033000, partial [Saponaria officinalis]